MKRDIKRATDGLKINMHYLLQTWVIRTKTKEEHGNKNNEAERDGMFIGNGTPIPVSRYTGDENLN